MRPVQALLVVSAFPGPAPGVARDPITISLSPVPDQLRVGDRLTLTVTLSNGSDVPRYVQPDFVKALMFNVRKSDGTLVLSQPDPPIRPQPYPRDSSDLIWVDKADSVRVLVRLPLQDFGIREAGVFRIMAFWNGIVVTESQLDAKNWRIVFLLTEPVEVSV